MRVNYTPTLTNEILSKKKEGSNEPSFDLLFSYLYDKETLKLVEEIENDRKQYKAELDSKLNSKLEELKLSIAEINTALKEMEFLKSKYKEGSLELNVPIILKIHPNVEEKVKKEGAIYFDYINKKLRTYINGKWQTILTEL